MWVQVGCCVVKGEYVFLVREEAGSDEQGCGVREGGVKVVVA